MHTMRICLFCHGGEDNIMSKCKSTQRIPKGSNRKKEVALKKRYKKGHIFFPISLSYQLNRASSSLSQLLLKNHEKITILEYMINPPSIAITQATELIKLQ